MRQVFTSQRVETVEGVARLLTDAGIEVAIRNGRSYHSKRSGQFSYIDPKPVHEQPTLWVRHSDDQVRAREILREAGLIDSTRPEQHAGFIFADTREAPRRLGLSWTWRIRLVLFALIAAMAIYIWLQPRPAAAPASDGSPQAAPAEEEVRIRITPGAS